MLHLSLYHAFDAYCINEGDLKRLTMSCKEIHPYTITFQWNRCSASLWRKWVLFKIVWCSIKVIPHLCPIECYGPLVGLQIRHSMIFYLTKHQNYQNSKKKVLKKPLLLLSKVVILNLWFVSVFMPLEIKSHTVPHLKGVNSCLELSSRPGLGSTFTLHNTTLKSTHFPS